jgi:hypothetical protein
LGLEEEFSIKLRQILLDDDEFFLLQNCDECEFFMVGLNLLDFYCFFTVLWDAQIHSLGRRVKFDGVLLSWNFSKQPVRSTAVFTSLSIAVLCNKGENY